MTQPTRLLLILVLTLPLSASDTSRPFAEAEQAMASGQTAQALLLYQGLATHPDQRIAGYAAFFSGQTLLRLNRAEEAIPWLARAEETARSLGQPSLLLYARFHLAIADGMLGKTGQALARLDQIPASGHAPEDTPLILRSRIESLRLSALLLQTSPGQIARQTLLHKRDALLDLVQRSPQTVKGQSVELETALEAVLACGDPAAADGLITLLDALPPEERNSRSPLKARALALAGKTMEALRLLPADPGAALPPVLARVGILAASGQRDLAAKEASAAMAGRSVEERARLGGVAGHLWLDLGRFAEAAPLIELAMRSSDPKVRTQALADGASLALASGDSRTAIRRIRESGLKSEAAIRLEASALLASTSPSQAEALLRNLTEKTNTPALALLRAQILTMGATNDETHRLAQVQANTALRLARASDDTSRIAWASILLARLSSGTNAAAILEQILADDGAGRDLRARATAFHDLGLLALREGRPSESLTLLGQAGRLFETWRAPWGRQDRLYSSADWAGTRRHMALAWVLLGKTEEAWSAFEDSLSRELREERSSRTGSVCTGPESGRPEAVTPIIFRQTLAGEKSLAAMYLLWEDAKPGILFLCAPGQIRIHALPPSSKIRAEALAFSRMAARPLVQRVWDPALLGTRTVDSRDEYRTRGRWLRQNLLEPVLNAMSNTAAENLLIISDGALSGLPFAAIPLEDSPDGICLGERVSLAQPASASLWLTSLRTPPAQGPALLAGDTGERRIADGRLFSALPGSGLEMERIAALAGPGARVLRGEQATLPNLRGRPDAHSPAILHLATHGYFFVDPLDGRERGALLLAATGRSGASLDERSITDLPLAGSLVTLSACDTALGEIVAGEGMRSLMRAFIAAGARSVTASLWQIGDSTTVRYMELLYEELKSGLSPARAHRAVRERLRRAGYEPWRRSAFICTG